MIQWAFWLFGGLALLGALGTVTRRSPVQAALFLVLTLVATGGLFLVLHASFLAAIQVLVYAGAVMVLFLFVVMSVSHTEGEALGLAQGTLGKLIGVGAVGLLLHRMLQVCLQAGAAAVGAVPLPAGFGDVRSLGRWLFSRYLLPFETISVLLLVAIVAAVAITRRPDRGRAAGEG
ncbi:MAG: NADH-quinone oxidoreductase subunit J [Proteobacteria bacterium]|nr:NADH-quinone oxidoreductase subunit J [Pseudomonadota bacterium]